MHKRLFTAVLFAVLGVAAPAAAQFQPPSDVVPAEEFHLELGAMFWQPTPELQLTTGDALVGTVDFVGDLGIPDTERFRQYHAVLRLGRKHKLRASYMPFTYDVDAVLQRTVTFANRTYPVNAATSTQLEWKLFRGGYEWDLVARSRGFFGLLAEVKYNRVAATLDASGVVGGVAQTLSATVEQTAPIPTVGGIARVYLADYLSLSGEFTGLKLDRTDFYAKFYDFDVYGDAHLGRNLGVRAGYRSIDVDYRVDGDAGTMKMTGPYVGGFLRF